MDPQPCPVHSGQLIELQARMFSRSAHQYRSDVFSSCFSLGMSVSRVSTDTELVIFGDYFYGYNPDILNGLSTYKGSI